MNDLLLRALRCEITPRPPVWLMRQAGRFMPEYRALRARYSFRTLITTPELAVQVTKLPLDLLGPDAAILFSDILLLPEAFGFTIDFTEGQGIRLLEPVDDRQRDIDGIFECVARAIRQLKKEITVPLIGFCGGPYTVAKYMKRMTPAWLDQITTATIDYLKLQIQAGVDVIQVFDSWAGYLEPHDFQALSLPYLKRIVEALAPSKIPVILFCRGSGRYIPELTALHPQGIGFDWEKEMHQIRKEVSASIAVQGNLDPAFLKGPIDVLQNKARSLLASMQGVPGFIFNLGHGVEPETPVENVQWLIRYVKGEL